MSGICAIWRQDDAAGVGTALGAMARGLSLTGSERLAHKADAEGGVAVCAGFARQQLFESDSVLLVCDADQYTAEVLAGLYERGGARFIETLDGGFSVVLWDRRERRLLAAVDGFGINRLVYFQNGKTLAIASRLDGLVQAPGVRPEVDPRGIANFLNFGVNLAPQTILRNVQRLSPGTLLTKSKGNYLLDRYWDMQYGIGSETNEDRLSRQLEETVERAVAANCREQDFSQVGAYLSGGTDSSTVVGMMSRLGRGPVNTFSIGFEEERFNELEYAEITARKFKAKHHTYLVSADDCLEALPKMVRYFDEPFANSSAIPTYFCGRLAARHGVKVLLAGDGGDELFGGNERYKSDKIFQAYHSIPKAMRKGLIEPILKSLPMESGFFGKARRYVNRSNLHGAERFYSYNFLCAYPPETVFRDSFLAQLHDYSVLDIPRQYFDTAPARDHLDKLLYVDVKITLGDSDLPKVTRMSELAGILTRFPFLDREVAGFSGRIPPHLKVKGLDKRYLFKRAFRNLLPIEVIKKKKHGFGIPVATWLKSDSRLREMSRDMLFSARATQRGYFRREFLEELIRKHEADDSTYYGDTLWSFFVLELWHQQFVDVQVGAAV
ncbi:MAG: asparagine synthase-related protein [Candidatus Solibacter sp.]